jgi:hypothetical protein
MLHPKERNWSLDVISREMNVLRNLNMGITFFRSKFLTDNVKGVYSFTKDFNRTPALIPPTAQTGKRAPSAVTTLRVTRGKTTDKLFWQGARDNSGADYLLYNIYASESWPVDTKNPENLIASRLRAQQLTVPHKGRGLHYAVTASDRYNQESTPVMSEGKPLGKRKPIDFRQLILGNSPNSTNKQIFERKR